MSRVKSNDGMAFLSAGDTFLVVWREPAREQRIKWLFDQIEGSLATQPGGVIGMQLILPSSSPPDGPARAENYKRMREIGSKMRRVVTVPLGDALWITLVRSIMRGLMLVTGQSKIQVVADNEEQGYDLLYEAASAATPSRKHLSAGFDEMFATLGIPRGRSTAA